MLCLELLHLDYLFHLAQLLQFHNIVIGSPVAFQQQPSHLRIQRLPRAFNADGCGLILLVLDVDHRREEIEFEFILIGQCVDPPFKLFPLAEIQGGIGSESPHIVLLSLLAIIPLALVQDDFPFAQGGQTPQFGDEEVLLAAKHLQSVLIERILPPLQLFVPRHVELDLEDILGILEQSSGRFWLAQVGIQRKQRLHRLFVRCLEFLLPVIQSLRVGLTSLRQIPQRAVVYLKSQAVVLHKLRQVQDRLQNLGRDVRSIDRDVQLLDHEFLLLVVEELPAGSKRNVVHFLRDSRIHLRQLQARTNHRVGRLLQQF